MREYDFRPNKRLGQDFLIDRNIADKIIRFAGIDGDDTVLEIGAGIGNITEDIARTAKKVVAVEYDRRLCAILKENLSGCDNVEIVCRDILGFDIAPYAQGNKLKVIGNLPYYITSPILEYLITNSKYVSSALLMVQKEVGERMLAKEGGKALPAGGRRSPISCYIQYYTRPGFKGVVKRTSFFPAPEVDSALIYLEILDSPSVAVRNEDMFFKVIKGAFNQRRKMLLSSLSYKKRLGFDKEKVKEVLGKAGVAPERRPETLSLKEFGRIADGFAG